MTPTDAAKRARHVLRVGALALVWFVFLFGIAFGISAFPHNRALGTDFMPFYAAGLTLRHSGNPYNWAQLQVSELHLRSIGNPALDFTFNDYANPPFFAWAMIAFTHLSLPHAYTLWLALMAGTLVAALILLGRSYGVCGRGWLILLFALTPPAAWTYFFGQQTPLLLLALVSALIALRRHRPVLAGVALSIGWLKPHLLLPIALALIVLLGWRDARRLIAGFLGASVAVIGVYVMSAGPSLLASWTQYLVFRSGTTATQPVISSLAGCYLGIVGRPWSTVIGAALVVLWSIFVAALGRHTRRQKLVPADDAWLHLVALAVVAWLLATPYTHPTDLVLLAVAMLPILGRRVEALRTPSGYMTLAIMLIAPEADILAPHPTSASAYSVLVPLIMLIALRPWSLLNTPHIPPRPRVTRIETERVVPVLQD